MVKVGKQGKDNSIKQFSIQIPYICFIVMHILSENVVASWMVKESSN